MRFPEILSNGKAESAVKQAKKIMLKYNKTGSDVFLALLDHRKTPLASMQISPAQRLFSRRTRSLLPMTAALLKPSALDEDVTHTKLHRRQQQQAKYYNRGARDLQPLEPGGTGGTVARNSVLIISHITFGDCWVHIFSYDLSPNNCI